MLTTDLCAAGGPWGTSLLQQTTVSQQINFPFIFYPSFLRVKTSFYCKKQVILLKTDRTNQTLGVVITPRLPPLFIRYSTAGKKQPAINTSYLTYFKYK